MTVLFLGGISYAFRCLRERVASYGAAMWPWIRPIVRPTPEEREVVSFWFIFVLSMALSAAYMVTVYTCMSGVWCPDDCTREVSIFDPECILRRALNGLYNDTAVRRAVLADLYSTYFG
jgi:hypothetical protein